MSVPNMENWQRNTASPDVVATIAAEIECIRSLELGEVRALWRKTFKRDVPKALTRDLLVRMLAWNIQEQAFGGHDRATQIIPRNYARGKQVDFPESATWLPKLEAELFSFPGNKHDFGQSELRATRWWLAGRDFGGRPVNRDL